MPENTIVDASWLATGSGIFSLSGARGKHRAIYFDSQDNTWVAPPRCGASALYRGGVLRQEWLETRADGHALEAPDFINSLN